MRRAQSSWRGTLATLLAGLTGRALRCFRMRALLERTLRMSRRRRPHSAHSILLCSKRRCWNRHFPAHRLTRLVASQLEPAYLRKALRGLCLRMPAGHLNRTEERRNYPANYGGLWRTPGQNRAHRGRPARRLSAAARWGSASVQCPERVRTAPDPCSRKLRSYTVPEFNPILQYVSSHLFRRGCDAFLSATQPRAPSRLLFRLFRRFVQSSL